MTLTASLHYVPLHRGKHQAKGNIYFKNIKLSQFFVKLYYNLINVCLLFVCLQAYETTCNVSESIWNYMQALSKHGKLYAL